MSRPEAVRLKERLVKVEPDGLGPCVDGRLAKKKGLIRQKLRGPKIQGGVLGVAALGSGKSTQETIGEEDIRLACRKYRAAGFTSSVHGDTHHREKGCGFGRLWLEGMLSGLPKLGVSLERIREIVVEEGGQYVELEGEHTEQLVAINFMPQTTMEPDGSMFIVDAWSAGLFGIDQGQMIDNAKEVVKKLNGPDKIVEIR